MLEDYILIAQAIMVAMQAAWLTLGVRDNMMLPIVNGQFTAQVMTLERMQEMYPSDYELMKRRAINNPTIHRLLFGVVVAAELVACLALWAGVIALLMGFFGQIDADMAKVIALAGTVAFTSVWAGFLVVGNHFAYWFCHDGAQNTHYQMTLWGMATTIFVVL